MGSSHADSQTRHMGSSHADSQTRHMGSSHADSQTRHMGSSQVPFLGSSCPLSIACKILLISFPRYVIFVLVWCRNRFGFKIIITIPQKSLPARFSSQIRRHEEQGPNFRQFLFYFIFLNRLIVPILWYTFLGGAGIAQWLERRTRDWKVAGSNPCWNGGRILFSRVDFLCWLLFRYPFHPRVTTVARKKSRSFCQKCRWQVTAKHAYTLRIEPCFGIGHNLSLICQMTSEDIKHQLNNNNNYTFLSKGGACQFHSVPCAGSPPRGPGDVPKIRQPLRPPAAANASARTSKRGGRVSCISRLFLCVCVLACTFEKNGKKEKKKKAFTSLAFITFRSNFYCVELILFVKDVFVVVFFLFFEFLLLFSDLFSPFYLYCYFETQF